MDLTPFNPQKEIRDLKKFCPDCKQLYIIGLNGIITRCDKCAGIVRNKLDGTIINEQINVSLLGSFADEQDLMTDMEKA